MNGLSFLYFARVRGVTCSSPALLYVTRIGGSGPEEALGRVLAAPVLYLGVALPEDRFHAPNERMVLDQFWKGVLAAAELWTELGAATP